MVQAAGIPDFSKKIFNSSSASPSITPCPQTTSGFSDLLIISTAFSTSLLESVVIGV